MPNPDFFGPFLKVERAEHHINKLETIFNRYISDNMKRLRPKKQQRALKEGRNVIGGNFPKHTPTILGDAIHNLHAALDHAYCILVTENGGEIDRYTVFPFGGDRKSLEGSINGHKKLGITPSDAVCDFILDEMQPYEGGKLRLYELHDLDITDKHHILLPTKTVFHISSEDPLRFRDAAGNYTGGYMSDVRITANQGNNPTGAFLGLGAGSAVMHGNPKTAFEITFPEGEPLEGESVLHSLRQMHETVRRSLEKLVTI